MADSNKELTFFLKIANVNIKHTCIENPVGIMNKIYRVPDQIIQPYYFGDEAQKTTCLWLKNLPKLYHNDKPNLFDNNITHVGKGEFVYYADKKTGILKRQPKWFSDAFLKKNKNTESHGKVRSKTFPGIATAMATQWTEYLLNN